MPAGAAECALALPPIEESGAGASGEMSGGETTAGADKTSLA
jgi:hypothetical protein